jgi:hypothetical protein
LPTPKSVLLNAAIGAGGDGDRVRVNGSQPPRAVRAASKAAKLPAISALNADAGGGGGDDARDCGDDGDYEPVEGEALTEGQVHGNLLERDPRPAF